MIRIRTCAKKLAQVHSLRLLSSYFSPLFQAFDMIFFCYRFSCHDFSRIPSFFQLNFFCNGLVSTASGLHQHQKSPPSAWRLTPLLLLEIGATRILTMVSVFNSLEVTNSGLPHYALNNICAVPGGFPTRREEGHDTADLFPGALCSGWDDCFICLGWFDCR